MNRRDFHKMLGSAALMTGLPLPVKTAPAVIIDKGAYTWAAAIARVQNRMSPDLLVKVLHVSPEAAKGLCSELVRNGVVTAPNVLGASKAVSPIFNSASTIPTSVPGGDRIKSGLHKFKQLELPETETELVEPEESEEELTFSDDDPELPEASDEARSAE